MYVYRNFKSPARYSLSCRGPSGKCIQMTRLLLRSGVSISLFFSISNKTTFLERWRWDGFFDSLGGRFSTIFFYPFVIDVTTVLKNVQQLRMGGGTLSASPWCSAARYIVISAGYRYSVSLYKTASVFDLFPHELCSDAHHIPPPPISKLNTFHLERKKEKEQISRRVRWDESKIPSRREICDEVQYNNSDRSFDYAII